MNLFPDWQTLARSGYLFRVVDSGPDTVDRVTVLFSDGDALGCDRTGGRAFSQWVGHVDPATLESWVEAGEAVDLSSDNLSDEEKAHILRRVNEAWRDCLELIAAEAKGEASGSVKPSRDSAFPNEGTHLCGGEGLYLDGDGRFWVRLDGAPEDDRGPFTCPGEALRNTLPDEWGLAGPEYHSPAFPEA